MKRALITAALIAMALTNAYSAERATPIYELDVSFDLERGLLAGTAVITAPEGSKIKIDTGTLRVSSITVDGAPADTGRRTIEAEGRVVVSYEAETKDAPDVADVENVGVVTGGVIGERGIYLTEGWYPAIEGLAFFRLTATMPEGLTAISEAEEITLAPAAGGVLHTFVLPHPVDGISLVAARYEVRRETLGGTEVYAYLFPEDAHFAESYIEHTKGYLSMYSEMLGPYPYRRFSVVENFLPTGYSMPTFTLLGSTVVNLPFIVETSLGHEVLHQWFGNYVYADYSTGNWMEGLTTYLADHLYEDRRGRGWEYRKKAVSDFQSYVAGENDKPLSDFVQRSDFASRAIGYGKSAMVFHMLKNLLGEDAFYSALRSFVVENGYKRASWADLRAAFEAASGMELGWFFEQWLGRKGAPELVFGGPRVVFLDGLHKLSMNVEQKGEAYRLSVPIKVTTTEGEESRQVEVSSGRELVEIAFEPDPVELVIDGGYDLMRRLSAGEYAPAVSALIGGEEKVVVLPEEGADKYGALTELLISEGFETVNEENLAEKDISSLSLLFLGQESPTLKRLFGEGAFPGMLMANGAGDGAGFEIIIRKNPFNPMKVAAVVEADSASEVELAARKIFRYGGYSRLVFRGGGNVVKETAPSERGIRVPLRRQVLGIRPNNALGLDEIIKEVVDVPIIYVGEGHNQYEDHKVQLAVIRGLDEAGKKFAIGMEMFQRPYQASLDEYMAGEITEKEFLRSSEYFKRWRFNYLLYREILEFARERGIPVIALNQKAEIIRKVASGGLGSLSPEEIKEVPAGMDMSDEAYRQSLLEVFGQHKNSQERNFEYFYQAQVLWDETMAHAIDSHMEENPGGQMVVVAGSGHIAYGHGIPGRAYRLNGMRYVTLLNSKAGTPMYGLADYVLFPEPDEAATPPVLGVTVEADDKEVVLKVKEISPGGLAARAGIREGDTLLSIDGAEVRDVEDIRIALFDKQGGDTITMKIRRKRFLRQDKEMELSIKVPF